MAGKQSAAPVKTAPGGGAASRSFSSREVFAAVFAVVGEVLVVLLSLAATVPMAVVVAVHVIISAIAAVILFWNRQAREDLTIDAAMCLIIAVSGPAGAVASLAMLIFAGHAGAGPEVLQSWYARLANASGNDRATAMHDRVMAGRVVRFDDRTPHDFSEIIATGTLTERQAALGLMARRFHTDFAPALALALRSPEPVVRVQAAAVVARVRGDLKVRTKTLLASANGDGAVQSASLAEAAELLRLADCAFVDRADGARCRRGADNILAKALSTGRGVTIEAAHGNSETALVVERFLVGAGRFKDFRVSRRVHDLITTRSYRVRRIGSHQVSA